MVSLRKTLLLLLVCILFPFSSVSFKQMLNADMYAETYMINYKRFYEKQERLIAALKASSSIDRPKVKSLLDSVRLSLKSMDFWLRYLDPIIYKKINAPLPVEWETEVFEKFEKPYRRDGAGYILAELYLQEEGFTRDSLVGLLSEALIATKKYSQDSILENIKTSDHFYLSNRLYLLNLASIYTTGFECPDSDRIVPELTQMLGNVGVIYRVFNASFPQTPLPEEYFSLYGNALSYLNNSKKEYESFDHFTFIRDYIDPLFRINQELIRGYHVKSHSTVDYSLNNSATSIFDKDLYHAQNTKGVFHRVQDQTALNEIREIGKLLFSDPIVSGNNLRSCASCHKPDQYFTDTASATSLAFDGQSRLKRNSPTLLNAQYNHLLMADGKHSTLMQQVTSVINSKEEMHCAEKDLVKKIKSCKTYRDAFNKFTKLTPHLPELSVEHIGSAIILYYTGFDNNYSAFDLAIKNKAAVSEEVRQGFNLFMGKAQCGTCHFPPHFNGVKPPFVGSEFEVLGTPADIKLSALSDDPGRFGIHAASETNRAFRTGALRNISRTAPYMHNGVFKNLDEVVEFYNKGGGMGQGLNVSNQTLSSDSLALTAKDKANLIAFLRSLDENIAVDLPPSKLPESRNKILNQRRVGGQY